MALGFGGGSISEQLEAIVDKVDLPSVIEELAHIAWAKGEHLRGEWQDRRTAALWDQDAKKLEALAPKINRHW